MLKRLYRIALPVVAMMLTAGCHSVDDDRIPPSVVEIPFATSGVWDAFGVPGATSYRYFIKKSKVQESIPVGYQYTASSQTGFGGVVVVRDFLNELHAYDMACPVEVKRDIRVYVDSEENVARCEKCGSTYDIFRYGAPLSGEAHAKGYGLTRYNVYQPGPNGLYLLVGR